WITKGAAATGLLNNPKLVAALFSDDALKNKRNTEAVEVTPKTLVAARVLEHKPAVMQPLDAVKADIEKRLVREEALKLAQKTGEAYLAKLNKGEQLDLAWGATHNISQVSAPGIAPESLRAIFSGSVAKLPAYTGASLADGGYALYRTNRIKAFVVTAQDNPRSKTLREQYARIMADEDFSAWLASVRSAYPVEINKAALESKERQ
ncbi:MAG: peptidylprolyl isomerase, partial [Proteobacteria bacterium]|nr:peptidylprolyl isomerase [Pseudomonadota bacterium]